MLPLISCFKFFVDFEKFLLINQKRYYKETHLCFVIFKRNFVLRIQKDKSLNIDGKYRSITF